MIKIALAALLAAPLAQAEPAWDGEKETPRQWVREAFWDENGASIFYYAWHEDMAKPAGAEVPLFILTRTTSKPETRACPHTSGVTDYIHRYDAKLSPYRGVIVKASIDGVARHAELVVTRQGSAIRASTQKGEPHRDDYRHDVMIVTRPPEKDGWANARPTPFLDYPLTNPRTVWPSADGYYAGDGPAATSKGTFKIIARKFLPHEILLAQIKDSGILPRLDSTAGAEFREAAAKAGNGDYDPAAAYAAAKRKDLLEYAQKNYDGTFSGNPELFGAFEAAFITSLLDESGVYSDFVDRLNREVDAVKAGKLKDLQEFVKRWRQVVRGELVLYASRDLPEYLAAPSAENGPKYKENLKARLTKLVKEDAALEAVYEGIGFPEAGQGLAKPVVARRPIADEKGIRRVIGTDD